MSKFAKVTWWYHGQAWSYKQVWAAASQAASALVEAAKIRPAKHVGMMLAGSRWHMKTYMPL